MVYGFANIGDDVIDAVFSVVDTFLEKYDFIFQMPITCRTISNFKLGGEFEFKSAEKNLK